MNLVCLSDLAKELGVDRSNARKIALKLGFVPTKRQIKSLGHNQRMLVWTPEQVEAIKAHRRKNGYEVPA